MDTRAYISLCDELGSMTGYKHIHQGEAKESLYSIIENFLKTGKIEYTKLPFRSEKKEKKVSFKPKGDKVYLWKAIGRFRKRPAKIGGNIRQLL